MSLPDEKLRALINTRQFMFDLLDPKKTPKVPMSVRQTAHRVCKHLPFPCEMEAYFKDEQMPIEYEMKLLKETVEDAISKYSQDNHAASWLNGIESKVFDIIENDVNAGMHFTDYQMRAMRELISRGYWIEWCNFDDKPEHGNSRVMLHRLPPKS